MRLRSSVPVIAGVLILAVLTGCVEADRSTTPDETGAPVGPVAPDGDALELEEISGIVNDNDVPATTLYTPDGNLSSAGADLASELDYWVSIGGRPDECAGVVSAPYLVSENDADDEARLDDVSVLLGAVNEIDEDRFGLIQLYARQFDDPAAATGFLAELTETVRGCDSYELVDGDTVTYRATGLQIAPIEGLPADVSGLRYVETLQGTAAQSVTTAFLQRDGIVISIYCETYASSTISQDDATALTGVVAERLGLL